MDHLSSESSSKLQTATNIRRASAVSAVGGERAERSGGPGRGYIERSPRRQRSRVLNVMLAPPRPVFCLAVALLMPHTLFRQFQCRSRERLNAAHG